MNRQAQAVVMLLLGGAVVKASVTDLYLRYVKEGLRPFLLAAGAVLIIAAAMTLWYDLRPARRAQEADPPPGSHHSEPDEHGPEPDEHGPEPDGHGHGPAHHEPRVGWLLILPVLGLLLVTPPALGSYTAGQAGTVPLERSDGDYSKLPPGDPVAIGLLDYASRAVYDEGRTLAGRRLQLTGFVSPGPDGQPMLVRIVMTCCAADGRPIKVGLTGGSPIDVPADTWVQVTGVYSTRLGEDPVSRADIAYLEVQQWQQITPPKRQYE